MTLRSARPTDVDDLTRMMEEFYREDSTPFSFEDARRAFGELVDNGRLGRVWLIQDGDETAGYIVMTYGFSMEFYGRDAFIDDFFIRKSRRGRGAGRRALEDVIETARNENVRALHLEARRTNDRVRRFYESLGFRFREHLCLATKLL